ncbi:PIN domain-containing protein [Nibricoccus aquaticus]|uniref:PIN domain-containing protein n=1 Tax=Nibricoccus aquaticus TaxID=2576891 RepID=UPI001586B088
MTPPTYVLVDFENVHRLDSHNARNFPADLVIFCGKNQNVNEQQWIDKMSPVFRGGVRIRRCTSTGPNALDFQLAFQAGLFFCRDPKSQLFIISADKGFDSLVSRILSDGGYAHRFDSLRGFLDRPQNFDRPQVEIRSLSGSLRWGSIAVTALTSVRIEDRPKTIGILANTIMGWCGPSCSYMDALKLVHQIAGGRFRINSDETLEHF